MPLVRFITVALTQILMMSAVFAQQKNDNPYTGIGRDSLKNFILVKHPQRDTTRLLILSVIAKAYADDHDYETGLPYAEEIASISREFGFETGLSGYYRYMGMREEGFKRPDRAMEYYDSAYSVIRDSSGIQAKRQLAYALYRRGLLNGYIEDYYSALQDLTHSARVMDALNDNNLRTVYTNISDLFLILEKPDQAAYYGLKAISFTEKTGKKNLIASSYARYAGYKIKEGKYEEALSYLRKAEKLNGHGTDFYGGYEICLNFGQVFAALGQYDSARVYLNESLMNAEKGKHAYMLKGALEQLVLVNINTGNSATAKMYLEKFESVLITDDTKKDKLIFSKLSAALYSMLGDYKKAFEFSEKSILYKDSLDKDANVKQINMLDARFRISAKQNELLKLQKEKELQDARLRQQAAINKVYIFSIALLLLIVFLVFRNFKSKQILHVQREELQSRKISELEKDKQLTAANFMMKGQEEERSRLAKDLHDGLGGLLSGVKHSILNMKENMILTEENSRAFERSVDMIDNSVKELRRVAHNMMPEALAKFGLADAIRDYCKSINASGAVQVSYQDFGESHTYEKSVETSVYRIIQELINNVIKHAEATEVLVQTVCNPDRISIAVEDNGKGFDTAQLNASAGAGWNNIRSRVDYLKGIIDLKSEAEKGTSIHIELQIP